MFKLRDMLSPRLFVYSEIILGEWLERQNLRADKRERTFDSYGSSFNVPLYVAVEQVPLFRFRALAIENVVRVREHKSDERRELDGYARLNIQHVSTF